MAQAPTSAVRDAASTQFTNLMMAIPAVRSRNAR
jgi:hypothetical protein